MKSYGNFNELMHKESHETMPIIYINSNYNYSEDELNILMLHEMTHAILVLNGRTLEGDAHGEDFIQKAHEIEKLSGYPNIINEVKFLNYLNKVFYILAIESSDYKDKVILGVFDSKKIFKWYVDYFTDEIEYGSPNIKNINKFYSKNSIFDSFDITNKKVDLKGNLIDIEEFNKNIFNKLIHFKK